MIESSNFFELIFANSRSNAILLMNQDGIMLSVNEAFTTQFGYSIEDVSQKHFKLLFIEEDQDQGKPEIELATCNTQGSANDDNFLVHKNGKHLWVSGESTRVTGESGAIYIVKIIHVVHSQKLLEQYLIESNRLIEALFESVVESGIVVIDSRMKIMRFNSNFATQFNLPVDIEGKRLTDLNTPISSDTTLKENVRNIFLRGSLDRVATLEVQANDGAAPFRIRAKLIEIEGEKRLLLVF